MKKILINKRFTLLELLIAVVILVIVSAIVVSIFQETLRSYKKGIAYSEISDSLSGSFMVMESDLSKLLPIDDKKNVYFKEKTFSFVALKETEKKKSYLQLIRYNYDEKDKKLYRAAIRYPADNQNIDGKDIAFCNGLESLSFKYSYAAKKSDDKKRKNDKDTDSGLQNNTPDLSEEDSNNNELDSDNSFSDINKSKSKSSTGKKPSVINITGRIKCDEVEQDFSTALFVRSMEAVKSSGTSADTDKKDNNSNNQNNNTKN